MTSLGYASPVYAQSLGEFGTPLELPRCGGWILVRDIPGYFYRDAMGCYPLFACRDWSQLPDDLAELGSDLVSLALVTDPFGEYQEADLRKCFDVVIPFKQHLVADLRRPITEIVSQNHRVRARRALRKLTVEQVGEPVGFLDEWIRLYELLRRKHNINGIRAFSRNAGFPDSNGKDTITSGELS